MGCHFSTTMKSSSAVSAQIFLALSTAHRSFRSLALTAWAFGEIA
jgi:hypothetical protein